MLKSQLGWMAAALLCSGFSQAGSAVGTAPADLVMPEQIDVVFNHNDRSRYSSPLTGNWRNGDDMEAWLIEAIDAANEEVLVAVQELSLPRIAQAPIAAQQLQPSLEGTTTQPIEPARQATLGSVEPPGRQRWGWQHESGGSLPH